MFQITEKKLKELKNEQDIEFLYELAYEVVNENPSLNLKNKFKQILDIVQRLTFEYESLGINQINTLKYMVKSHVYLGVDYGKDAQFDWIHYRLKDYSITDGQVTYVDAFYEILEDYKSKVLGFEFENIIKALQRKYINFNTDLESFLLNVFPEKVNFLKEINVFGDVLNCFRDHNKKIFILNLF